MRMKKVWKWILGILLTVCCFAGLVILDDMTVELEKVDYYNSKLPAQFYGYRILCVSDFHDSFFADQVSKIVNEEQPDIVLFLGDMTELNHDSWDNTLCLIKGIDGNIPVYGVLGNHEVMSPKVQEISRDLEENGMVLLNNDKITLTREDASIDLIGVRDITDIDGQLDGSWLVEQMRVYLDTVIDPQRFTLLACHRATLYPSLSDMSASLMLSGHIHGGVVRLPKVGGVFDVDGSLFPDYDKGFYSEGKMELFVSSGCDFQLSQMRLFNSPSVTMVTLKR